MVILIFIFLTPNWWFSSGEPAQKTVHQSPVVQTLVMRREDLGNEQDKGQIGQRIEALTGRKDVKVLEVRPMRDVEGRIRSFEVDIQ